MNQPSRRTTLLLLVCILTVGGLEALALMRGINGTALSTTVGAIAGLGGYILRAVTARRET